MTSRDSYMASSPLAPLSEIIKLEPEQEPWCAGYSPSQGRRCHARTNAHGRRSATILLNEGTKDLRAGRNIDALLENIAPHVLCTRFHQGQALDLTRRWKSQVRQYLDSRVASTISPRPVNVLSRIVYSEAAEANTERIALIEQRLFEAIEKVRRLEAVQRGLSIPANLSSPSEGGNTNVVVSPSSTAPASSRHTPPLNHVYNAARREPTQPVSQPAITIPRPAQLQVSPETVAVSALSPRSATPPLVIHTFSSTDQENSQRETSEPNRRQVEGECGICLCDLHIPQQDVDCEEEEQGEHADGDEYNDDNEDPSDDDDDDDSDRYDEQTETEDEHEHQNEELVWCKARCGVNFHKRCIDQWLESDHAPTCPMCRSKWKH
ncbi:hypothetical protein N7495_003625 [Penicillium taxi]|uniref:uncharacterized protein n=1 Tax=Penicillium taxi TaxID=168475 RepID=UPI002544EC42|nr:uncharacterized protein N7495_003625 [Penicillium taxi]KAJ5898881.1 hypothetical protein N7495_003625 [Penicillium taxi]